MARALDVIGEKWSLLMLRDLFRKGPLRFQEFEQGLPGLAPNTLSARLKSLESQGVDRHPPVREPSAALRIFPHREGQGARPGAQGTLWLGRALRISAGADVKPIATCNLSITAFRVAPMMEWTDRHCRYFLRLISKRALLYTEMVTAEAVLHGDRPRLLVSCRPSIRSRCSSAAAMPAALAEAARIGAEFGYDEINLNVGCPSGPRAGGPVRRLPDGRAGAGRRMRRGDARRASRCRSRSSAASASTTRMPRKASIASSTRSRKAAAAPSSCMRARPGSKA